MKKTYLDAIAELKTKGEIDEQLMEKASKQSNIDQMMQQMQDSGEVEQAQAAQQAPPPPQPQPVQAQQAQPQVSQGGVPAVQGGSDVAAPKKSPYAPPKLLKLVTVALLLKRVDEEKVQSILERFDQETAGTVIKYMYVDDLKIKLTLLLL